MCEVNKTYWIPYKDIHIPMTLRGFKSHNWQASSGSYGYPTFQMFVGEKYIGNHWCHMCPAQRGIYPTCERELKGEERKITRALNIIRRDGSKLRGDALRQAFKEGFGAGLLVEHLETCPAHLRDEWL